MGVVVEQSNLLDTFKSIEHMPSGEQREKGGLVRGGGGCLRVEVAGIIPRQGRSVAGVVVNKAIFGRARGIPSLARRASVVAGLAPSKNRFFYYSEQNIHIAHLVSRARCARIAVRECGATRIAHTSLTRERRTARNR